MKTFSAIVAVLGAPSLVSAAICNNNCGRAVAGTARQSPPFAARQSLCEAFVSATVTVTPGAVTVTANPVARRNVHAPRQAAPIITGAIPAYASACADASAYWSACQCFSGVLPTTVTVTAATPVVTVTRGAQSSTGADSSSVVESSSLAESSSSFVTITQVSSSTRTSTITSAVVSSVESSVEASSTEASSTEASSADTSTSTELSTTDTPSSSSATPVESSSSTTPSADGTTASVGSTCTPTPILPSPTSLISVGDDTFGSALLPFPVGVFGSNATTVYVSSNGFLSLYEGSTAYENKPLPSDEIPPVSILPFWDDLRVQPPSQAVQYQVFGSDAGSRNVTFEWVTVHLGEPSQFYHFTATFEEAQPGIVTYRYYTTYDQGESATVGVQNLRDGNNFSVQVGYNSPGSVPDRTFLRLDTTGAGTFTTGAFETSEC
ncbi:peptidase s8 and s53 subtilisin kexin sedolisin [Colletotrichum asianum]|uniref:Peptidase s8 and s53 subtilisin kexin sedolisin n=1 Tax=Colletotrichum asianum TaxID=702518 RepID=A0A8H3ZVR6_9PEZI|nr:peptidase s8 and s53 subtilisin kexin sedolisin [Colletotrichum asianum]